MTAALFKANCSNSDPETQIKMKMKKKKFELAGVGLSRWIQYCSHFAMFITDGLLFPRLFSIRGTE